MQRSGPLTSLGRLCIHELFERSWRRPISSSPSPSARGERLAQPRHVGQQQLGRQLDLAALGAQDLGDPRLQRPEVDPVRRVLERGERQPALARAEQVAVGAGAQLQVEQALGPDARGDGVEQLLRVAALER